MIWDLRRIWLGGLLLAFLISPALATALGTMRLDSLLTGLHLPALIFLLMWGRIGRDLVWPLGGLLLLAGAAMVTLLAPIPVEARLDCLWILALPLIFLLVANHLGKECQFIVFIKKFSELLAVLLILSVSFEVLTGHQLTQGTSGLDIADGAYKGLFFNANDMCAVACALGLTLGYLHLVLPNPRADRIRAMILIAGLGAVVVVGGSRLTLVVFAGIPLACLLAHPLTRGRTVLIALMVGAMAVLAWPAVLAVVLEAMADIPWLARSAERFDQAFLSGQRDPSIRYRREILAQIATWDQVQWLGLGPRNYGVAFEHLSHQLAARNPHAMILDIYLAFGVVGVVGIGITLISIPILVLGRRDRPLGHRLYVLICWGAVLAISFVPSSVFRLPLIWWPLWVGAGHLLRGRG